MKIQWIPFALLLLPFVVDVVFAYNNGNVFVIVDVSNAANSDNMKKVADVIQRLIADLNEPTFRWALFHSNQPDPVFRLSTLASNRFINDVRSLQNGPFEYFFEMRRVVLLIESELERYGPRIQPATVIVFTSDCEQHPGKKDDPNNAVRDLIKMWINVVLVSFGDVKGCPDGQQQIKWSVTSDIVRIEKAAEILPKKIPRGPCYFEKMCAYKSGSCQSEWHTSMSSEECQKTRPSKSDACNPVECEFVCSNFSKDVKCETLNCKFVQSKCDLMRRVCKECIAVVPPTTTTKPTTTTTIMTTTTTASTTTATSSDHSSTAKTTRPSKSTSTSKRPRTTTATTSTPSSPDPTTRTTRTTTNDTSSTGGGQAVGQPAGKESEGISTTHWILIGLASVIGLVLIAVLIVMVLVLVRRRRKQHRRHQHRKAELPPNSQISSKSRSKTKRSQRATSTEKDRGKKSRKGVSVKSVTNGGISMKSVTDRGVSEKSISKSNVSISTTNTVDSQRPSEKSRQKKAEIGDTRRVSNKPPKYYDPYAEEKP